MEILLTIVYVIVCLFLILVVLLQSGRAGDLASTFGGTSSQTALGSRGTANFLSRATTFSAVGFLILALALAIMSAQRSGSLLEGATAPETGKAPAAAPAEPPVPQPVPVELETGEGAAPVLPEGAVLPAPEAAAPAPEGSAPEAPPAQGAPPETPPSGGEGAAGP
jgi:preprotein translocase subunit SecG